MIVADTARLALRNLREAVLRTALTALGVAIGIASLVGMVSFGVAIQDQVVGSLLRSGVFDAVTVMPAPRTAPRGRRQGPTGGLQGTIAALRQSGPRVPLDDEAVKKLAGLANVKEAYPDVRVPVEVTVGEATEFAAAIGVPMSARGQGVFQGISFGKFFPDDQSDTCLISLEFAGRLTDQKPETLVGKQLTLAYASTGGAGAGAGGAAPGGPLGALNVQRRERPFTIIGIVERQAGPGGPVGMFAAVMIPLAKAREMSAFDLSGPQALLRQMADRPTYATVTVKVNRPQDTEEVEKKIKDLGFSAFSVADALQNEKRAFILLDLLLGLVGSIALTVASLGIVNTMVMSILERTREIGVMKAIGGSDEDVRRIFLIEAALIGLRGGVFGVFLGWSLGRVINRGANYYLQTQGEPAVNMFLIPWWLVAGALAFALLVSLVAGSFPAMRASRLDPIQALRHD